MEKNEELTRLAREQRQEIERLRAYIDGMHLALKRLPHVYREARRE